jgi:hypothetical protein
LKYTYTTNLSSLLNVLYHFKSVVQVPNVAKYF